MATTAFHKLGQFVVYFHPDEGQLVGYGTTNLYCAMDGFYTHRSHQQKTPACRGFLFIDARIYCGIILDACLPLGPVVTSKVTRCASRNDL